MKKYFAYLLPVLVLSFALCGCGRNNANDDNAVNTPIVTPMVTLDPSPSIMPDMHDGEVNDKDGIIEDKDNGSNNGTNNGNNNDTSNATTSPAPSASANP